MSLVLPLSDCGSSDEEEEEKVATAAPAAASSGAAADAEVAESAADAAAPTALLEDGELEEEGEGLGVGSLAAALPPAAAYPHFEFGDARRGELQSTFDFAAENGRLYAKQTYKLMFSKAEREEYGWAQFEEDLHATCGAAKESGTMAWGDVVSFLDDNL